MGGEPSRELLARAGRAEPADGEIPLASPAAGPRAALTLLSRGSPLVATDEQRRRLAALPLPGADGAPAEFDRSLAGCGRGALEPARLEIFQINLGKLCNMTCRHCHVDAGPDRTAENMDRATVDLCLAALDRTQCTTVDVTGGAPELNPHFEYLVDACVARGKRVLDRCNLTVLLLPRFRHLPGWLGERGVEIVCSLPHHRMRNTDAQRGEGAFDKSIEALRRLNAAGYGKGDPERVLTLVSNPAGAWLAADQSALEQEWRESLERRFGVAFDRLIALNNMPISRYLEWLEESGNFEAVLAAAGRFLQPGGGRRPDVPQHDLDCLGRPRLRLRLQPDARPRGGARGRPDARRRLRPRAAGAPAHRHRAPLLRLHRRRRQLLRRGDRAGRLTGRGT